MSRSMIFSKHNAEVDSQLAKFYGVSGFPTMVFTRPNGSEIDRIVGFLPPEEFIPAVLDLLQNRNTLDDYMTRLATYPDSFELRMEVADRYQSRGWYDKAKAQYKSILAEDSSNARGLSDNALMSLAQVELREKRYDEAVRLFQKLATEFPSSESYEDAHIYIPYTYMRAGENKKALKFFNEFKTKFPQSEELEWVDQQIAKIKEGKK